MLFVDGAGAGRKMTNDIMKPEAGWDTYQRRNKDGNGRILGTPKRKQLPSQKKKKEFQGG